MEEGVGMIVRDGAVRTFEEMKPEDGADVAGTTRREAGRCLLGSCQDYVKMKKYCILGVLSLLVLATQVADITLTQLRTESNSTVPGAAEHPSDQQADFKSISKVVGKAFSRAVQKAFEATQNNTLVLETLASMLAQFPGALQAAADSVPPESGLLRTAAEAERDLEATDNNS